MSDDFKVGDHVQFPASRFVWDKGPEVDGRWVEWFDDEGRRLTACATVIEVTDEYVVIEGGMNRWNFKKPIDPSRLWKGVEHGPFVKEK